MIKAVSDYLIFIDSDDYIETDTFSCFKEILKRTNNPDVMIIKIYQNIKISYTDWQIPFEIIDCKKKYNPAFHNYIENNDSNKEYVVDNNYILPIDDLHSVAETIKRIIVIKEFKKESCVSNKTNKREHVYQLIQLQDIVKS